MSTTVLGALKPGARAIVCGFDSQDKEHDLSQRLMEMGLTMGAEIEVAHEAPFGGAIAVRCRGTLIALRLADASNVKVSLR